MNLLFRQIWALIRKNLLIVVARRPIWTFIRAIALPLAIILVIAYSKVFFSSPQHWGVSSVHNIRSLQDGLAATPGRPIVGFMDNGMKNGEISAVIDSLSSQIRGAGKIPKLYDSSLALSQECRTDDRGLSPCYGAIIFSSSPSESSNLSSAGIWNYTLRGVSFGWGFADVRNDRNEPELDILPLQRAVDAEIVRQANKNKTSQGLPDAEIIVYTSHQQKALDNSRTANYLLMAVYVFGAIYAFTIVDIVYHMTSFITKECELGMTGLIDTMISGGSRVRGRIVRQISTYLSFVAVYLPSWLAIGIVISVVMFPHQSQDEPVGFLIIAGLSFASFSLFGASFFRKAQLSGAIMTVIVIVGAILPVVIFNQTKPTCVILSILFPSSNLSYFLTGTAWYELHQKKISMGSFQPDESDTHDVFRLPLSFHWAMAVVHTLLLPVLAFLVEHVLFSTASPHRRFDHSANEGDPTVVVTGLSKTYHPDFFARIFRRRKDVHAVQALDLKAYNGQILCLLGPNGCGKSTTMNSISGNQKMSAGDIVINSSSGLGYAPQGNVIWFELTVEEHIQIFSDLKCLSSVNNESVRELAKSVDLLKKLKAKATTLSGGQKRKLQMAMMFAGGSAVCCVDEVSTGLDPISRRRIWEILLTERKRRTIIMTTHFLDEADYLADEIAIMYKGSLRAFGTSASLKHNHGDGYTVKLPYHTDIEVHVPGETVQKERTRLVTVYRVTTAAAAVQVVEQLEANNLAGYQISGPTMEDLFLKVTGDRILESNESSGNEKTVETKDQLKIDIIESGYELTEGQPISAFKQWGILFCKRFRILRRRFIPYFVAIAFALVGAGVAPLLIKNLRHPMQCPTMTSLIVDDFDFRVDFGTAFDDAAYAASESSDPRGKRWVFGPASKLNNTRFDLLVDTYSTNHTRQYSSSYPIGYSNVSQITDQIVMVNTYDEFSNAINTNWQIIDEYYPEAEGMVEATIEGGFWVGDDNSKPTILGNIDWIENFNEMINVLDILTSQVPISVAYSRFPETLLPQLIDFSPLTFIIYFGLIMCCYPVFFILYPTNERISNVRSMQYSNGIRPLPLWLSHLAFDTQFVLVISVIAIALLDASTPVWTGLGYIFLIFFLYGVSTALFSYVISMFAKGAVSAWFYLALGQVVFYFAFFGAIIGIQTVTPYSELEGMMNKVFFGLGIISPAVCMERTLFIGLQQMALSCNGHPDSSIYRYGGPILFLLLQIIVLSALLLWWDSGFTLWTWRLKRSTKDVEETEMYNADLINERQRLLDPTTDLRVESVSKSFGKNLAVDNVTFGVKRSEIFALLGPNGAGKSTIISMIRGDIKPSTAESSISIAGHSILSQTIAARATLGVCPQFDSADVLTVKETLRFFAKTRGVKDIEHNVNTVIAACGIEEWTNQLAQKLSGGTKRKLSLAVALVGNPRVLVLDEPSSALDANAKRTLWRCLQTIANERAVVLTTHSMEEADALADRIGIVASRMLALGEREDLKKRAGENFHVHLVSASAPKTTAEELQVMKDWISATFPRAKVSRETQGGQIRFEVPTEGWEMVELIRRLESVKGDMGVEFYSVGKATLDEVFENIVRRYGDEAVVEL